MPFIFSLCTCITFMKLPRFVQYCFFIQVFSQRTFFIVNFRFIFVYYTISCSALVLFCIVICVVPYSKKHWQGKTLVNLANYSILPSVFANFYNFHNILYVNGLQFAKVFPTVWSLFAKLFYYQSFLLYVR